MCYLTSRLAAHRRPSRLGVTRQLAIRPETAAPSIAFLGRHAPSLAPSCFTFHRLAQLLVRARVVGCNLEQGGSLDGKDLANYQYLMYLLYLLNILTYLLAYLVKTCHGAVTV